MEVAVPVPRGTQLEDVAVSLVGVQNVEVIVGGRQLSVRLPAPGDPSACAAQLRPRAEPTELRITVAPLVASSEPEPEPQSRRVATPDTAQERRRAARVGEIEQRLAVLVTETADAERDGEAAAAATQEAAEACKKRRDQLSRLEHMVRMPPAQLEEMAANVGVGGSDAFVAKLQMQMEPLQRCISQHEEEEAAASTKQARASSRAAALRAEQGSLRTELEQLRSQTIQPATEVPATSDSDLAAYSLSPAEFVDCSAFADASVPFRSGGREGAAADRAAVALGDHGWAVCDNFVSEQLVRAVRREISGPRLSKSYEESEIWVGKEAGVGAQLSVPSVRGDRVLWLPDDDVDAGGHSAIAKIISRIDSFIFELMSPRLSSLAGLSERTDAMFAMYPGGGSKFTQHIDNTARDGRRLTVLCYLNPGDAWQDEHGGALRVHSGGRQGADSAVRVLPVAGRLAMFYADSMPHEVEESWRERHALTMWYYDKLERAEALEAAKIAGGANAAAEERERQEAQTLIRAMMAADPTAEPTAAECAALGKRVSALSPAALQIVSSIVGAPSASHFQQAAARLSPSELKKLRQDFSTMKA